MSETVEDATSGAASAVRQDGLEMLMLREVNHRVLNVFTMMQGNLRRELGPFLDNNVRDALRRHEGYVSAHGELHRCLVQGVAASAGPDAFFDRLLDALGRAVLAPRGVRWALLCDAAALDPVRCDRLALVVTELVINASKHAFGAQMRPSLLTQLGRGAHGWSCRVSDNGGGLPSAAAPGQGSRVVEDLVRSMGGTVLLQTGPHGTAVTVALPDEAQ